MTPLQLRHACRANQVSVFPSTLISGYVCLNLVVLERDYADSFSNFCSANSRACPLIWRGIPGEFVPPPEIAADCDLRFDLRSYDILVDGEKDRSVQKIDDLWIRQSVAFLIGSSVSFDGLIREQGLAPDWGPAVLQSEIACTPSGPFSGPMAVTLRIWRDSARADAVARLTARFPRCHGGPIHRGPPEPLGIDLGRDLLLPWSGGGIEEAQELIRSGSEPLWWACGVTPFLAGKAARLPLMIVHSPGNAMPSDLVTEEMEGSPLATETSAARFRL